LGRNDAASRRIDTIIGKESTFVGNIDSNGSIRIDGRYEGMMAAGGDIIVGETGVVQGKISAKNITVAGKVSGELEARGKLELVPTASVQGEAQMMFLVVEEGAFFQGQCSQVSREDLRERGKSLQVETPGE
jgi:cytoskeletal protein CcmA (bactofilin family)